MPRRIGGELRCPTDLVEILGCTGGVWIPNGDVRTQNIVRVPHGIFVFRIVDVSLGTQVPAEGYDSRILSGAGHVYRNVNAP